MKKYLDYAVTYLPLGSVFLYFYALLSILMKFAWFNISVVSFIEISEPLVNVLDIIPYVGISGFALWLAYKKQSSPGGNYRFVKSVEYRLVKKIKTEKLFRRRLITHFQLEFWSYQLFIWGLTILFFALTKRFAFLSLLLLSPITILGGIIVREYRHRSREGLSKTRYYIAAFLVLSFVLMTAWNIQAYLGKMYDRKGQGTQIIKKDGSEIKMTDSLIYVGKTNKYYFIYNKVSKYSEAIPTEEVASFRYRENN